jgi:hypothetical protein
LIYTFEKIEKKDQSKFVAAMIMNSKKSSLDDDDSKTSNEASFKPNT